MFDRLLLMLTGVIMGVVCGEVLPFHPLDGNRSCNYLRLVLGQLIMVFFGRFGRNHSS